jgi:hypothetical protein
MESEKLTVMFLHVIFNSLTQRRACPGFRKDAKKVDLNFFAPWRFYAIPLKTAF